MDKEELLPKFENTYVFSDIDQYNDPIIVDLDSLAGEFEEIRIPEDDFRNWLNENDKLDREVWPTGPHQQEDIENVIISYEEYKDSSRTHRVKDHYRNDIIDYIIEKQLTKIKCQKRK